MKIKLIALVLVLSSLSHAEVIDDRLSGYIDAFNLRTLETPARNRKLSRLGQLLFTSRLLSGNNNISCRDCHHPAISTHDAIPLGLGEGSEGFQTDRSVRAQASGHVLARNTPGLFNLHGIEVMFWDGRVSYDPISKIFTTPVKLPEEVARVMTSAIAAQAIFPLVDHKEMLGPPRSNAIANAEDEVESWKLLVEKLLANETLKTAFDDAFPDQKINIGHVGEALAEFQRHAFAFNQTPFDDYLSGNKSALTEVQKKGMDVFFGKGKCGECHQGAHLTNFEFHNVGIPQIGPGKINGDDLGRGDYTFRVPPLRNVGLTAPYMHNGSFKTLAEVVEHYDDIEVSLRGYRFINTWQNYIDEILGHDHRSDQKRLDTLSSKLTPKLEFEEEEEALVEFLTKALTDKRLMKL